MRYLVAGVLATVVGYVVGTIVGTAIERAQAWGHNYPELPFDRTRTFWTHGSPERPS